MSFKKCTFYSVITHGRKKKAVKHEGYTDGEFNYYKTEHGYWYCIEPNTGLSIVCSESRKKAYEYKEENKKRVYELINNMTGKANAIDTFKRLMKEAV